VQQKAVFPGDEDTWLADHTNYPDSERNAHIGGIVYVEFIIEKDSSISGVKLVRGVSPALNQEALRVVRAMPKWKPAMQDGKPIRVYDYALVHFEVKQ
jgi:TonB family protein